MFWASLTKNPLARWIAGVSGALFVLMLTYLKIRHDGYQDGKKETLEKIEDDEQDRAETARNARDDVRDLTDNERVRVAERDPNNRLNMR